MAVVASSLLASALSAQTAPDTSKTSADGEIVKLSTFNVSTDRDYGYRASNSIAATRSDTPIKDVPLNIQVFTKDLYEDLAITNQVDLERYNASMINGGSDIRSDNPIQQAYNAFLFRGFVQNWGLRDGIRQYDPIDTQGLARVEIVKGPAAALYGLSYSGGVMNSITKDVDFTKNFTSLRTTVQDEGGLRGTADANFSGTLSGGKVGIRYNGAYAKTKDERAHSKGAIRYSQVNIDWLPLPDTQFKFLGELGYREKPNGLGYFSRGETNAAGVALDNGSDVPLQITHPEIPWTWNWSNGRNMRSLDTKLYRGSVVQKIGEDLQLTGYVQYSDRQQIDGNGWDANGGGGADSWEAGGGWIIDPVTKAESIQSGYSYRDWSNSMHSYGATAVYKLNFDAVKNTFTFGSNVWSERFVSRSSTQAGSPAQQLLTYQVKAGIPIDIPFAPPSDLHPVNTGNGYTHEINSNDYYFVSWQGALIDNRLKLNASVNRTNLKLVQWASGSATTYNLTKVSKNSPMVGGVFDITKEYSVFVVHGTSLFPSTDKNSFGAQMPPETGSSYEGGFKFDVADGFLSGTLSYYQITKKGGGRQVSPAENRDTARWDADTAAQRLIDFPGKTRADLLAQGDFFPAGKQKSKGFEADAVVQATRNWQILLSYANNDVKVVESPSAADIGKVTIGHIRQQIAILNKYTFSEGELKGLYVGVGLQHAGKALQDYNGPAGAPRYNPSTTYLEAFTGFRTKFGGYNSIIQLNVKNITKQKEFVGWKATGSSTVRATQRYEVPTDIRYELTFGIDL